MTTTYSGHTQEELQRATRSGDEDEEYYVMAMLDFDPDEYEVNTISRAFCHGGYENYGLWDYDTVIDYFLPAGVYNFWINFIRKSDRAQFFVYKENVVIDGDMEFSASPSEADQLITFEPIGPDGKPLSGPVKVYENGEETGVADEGYLIYTDEMFLVKSRLFGDVTSFKILHWAKWIEDGELKTNCMNRVYASKSDDLFFCGAFGGLTTDSSLVCLLTSDGSKTQNVTNTTDYITFGQRLLPTPDQPLSEEGTPSFQKGHSCVNNYYICYNGVPGVQNKTIAAGKRFNQDKIMIWQAPADMRSGMSVMVVPSLYEGYEGYGYLEGLPLVADGEDSFYAGVPVNSSRFRYNSDGVYNLSLCSNPFRTLGADQNPLWGQGFPCLSVYRDTQGLIGWSATGPLGEKRTIDDSLLKVDTDLVVGDNNTILVSDGDKLELTLTDTNFVLGDIAGTNVTEISLEVKDAESVPPTVQSFRTTDTEGNVSNEFMNPADGKAGIYCGLFTVAKTATGVRYYECETPAEVVLEYSPFGAASWKELDVEAEPDYDFMPGWGKYYEASLSTVDVASANEWYDLRLTVIGGNGEKMVQTVSPAFRIKGNVSVEGIGDDACGAEVVAVYSLQGIRLDRPEAGQSCILVMSDGSIRKVMR